jgi:hypothetical protein
MSENLGSAVLELSTDNSKLKSGLKSAETDMKSSAATMSKAIDVATSSVSSLGKKLADTADKQAKLGIAYEKAIIASKQAAEKTREMAAALETARTSSSTTAEQFNKLNLAYQKSAVDSQAAIQKVKDVGKALTEAGGSTQAYARIIDSLSAKMPEVARKSEEVSSSIRDLGQKAAPAAAESTKKLADIAGFDLTRNLDKLKQVTSNAAQGLINFGENAGGRALAGIKGLVNSVSTVSGKLGELGNKISNLGASGSGAAVHGFERLGEGARSAAQSFANLSEKALGLGGKVLTDLGSRVKEVTSRLVTLGENGARVASDYLLKLTSVIGGVVGGAFSKLTAGVGSVVAGLLRIGETAADPAAKGMEQLTARTVETHGSFIRLGSVGPSVLMNLVDLLGKVGLAAMGLRSIADSAAGLAKGLLGGNAALEMTTISFKTLLGSASAADKMIKDLTAFARLPPLN